MRPIYAPEHAPPLLRTPNHRHRAIKQRLAVICVIAGLALASGLIGSLIQPASGPPSGPTVGHPFSYFPSE